MTKKKTAANRKNAALSTGPKDTETTSQNAVKHGLTSAQPNKVDFQTGYNEMLAGLMAELRPAGLIESLYVQRAALGATRLQRLVRLQAASLDAPQQTAGSRSGIGGLSPLDLYRIVYRDKDSGDQPPRVDHREAFRTMQALVQEVVSDHPSVDTLVPLLERFSNSMDKFLGEGDAETVANPAAALAAEVPNSKMLRYETQKNSMYRALHELERLKRLRAGDRSVTAPISVDVTHHGDGEGESVS